MKTFLWATVLLAAAAGGGLLPADAAEPRYDRTLEKAAATIAAGKMGELRGGFAFAQRVLLVPPVLRAPMAAEATGRRPADAQDDGLVPAVERPRSHSIY
ncbi:MAG TPA: hypothetical protein PKD01_10060 [Mesorhizobium sp.]|nr:hypothetical protein [Mesorhizobium sp.]